MSPQVSILTSVYNSERFLPELIDSLIKQTYQDFEFVVVNDGSTDNSLKILQSRQRELPNMVILSYTENRGISAGLNLGLDKCQGKYVLRLDADDLLAPTCLEKEVVFLEKNPAYDGVICDELKVDENLNPKTILLKLGDDYYIKKQNLFRTAYGGPTTMVKREKYFEAGKFDETVKVGPDRIMALDMHKITKLGHVAERLYLYRMHQKNISQTSNKYKKSREFKSIRENREKKYFKLEDYINDWQKVKEFKDLEFDYKEIRLIKYANVILKCALQLAKNSRKKLALAELEKAKYINAKSNFIIFQLAIKLGIKRGLDKLYQNMNIWTNYAYDDFYLVEAKGE